MTKTMNIMLVSDQKYIFPMITLIYSIFTHNSNPINVYLFYSDIDDNTLFALESYCKHWDNKKLIPIFVDAGVVTGLKTTTQFPAEVYYKLLAIDLLPCELDKVLCMDLDMVVNKSLSPLFELDLTPYPLAACSGIYAYIYGEGLMNHKRLDIDTKHTYFNAGLMLFNLDYLRREGGSMRYINHAFEINDILKWPEQDVLNQLYADKYLELNWYDYNCPPVKYIMKNEEVARGIYKPLHKEEIQRMASFDGYADYTQALCDNATVLHYLGDTKPWNQNRPDVPTFQIFDRYFLIYADEAVKIFEQVNS